MKQQSIALLIIVVMMIIGTKTYAYDIAVANDDGVTIYYNIINNDTELCVVSGDRVYTCETLVIPETVNYADKTYKVTAIGELYGNTISSITIPNTVTKIDGNSLIWTAWYKNQPDGLVYAGKVAYRYKGAMPENTNIIIEEGTLGISDYAFSDYSNLSSITIPNSVMNIGNQAFKGCSNLTSIVIPNSVTSIGRIAFMDCINLNSVSIPSSVFQIGEKAFLNTAWYDNQPDGVIYAGNVAYYYKGKMPENASVIIEDGTVGIADNAFKYCINLTSISFPNSLKNIGSEAFQSCSGLKSVDLPNNMKYIGHYAFDECSGLTSVVLSNNVDFIGQQAFGGCSGLTSINIPEGVKEIWNYTFIGCRSLNSITIPKNVTSIGDYAFQNCSGLTSIIMNEGLLEIGNSTFKDCSGLTSVYLPNSVKSIGENTFENCISLNTLTFGEGITRIGKKAFDGCNSLNYLIVKNDYLGTCFSGLATVKEVTFEESVKYIGAESFKDCTGLTTIIIKEGVQSIGNSAFSGCISLSDISFPNSITNIEYRAFENCIGLKQLFIPKSVSYIGVCAFTGCSGISSIVVDKDNPYYDSRDNCNSIILTADNTLIIGCDNSIIPNGISKIGQSAFSGCSSLTTLTIPNSVTQIDYYSFHNCSGLNKIVVEGENQFYDSRDNCNAIIETSTNKMIYGCNNTVIPNSVISIDNDAFSNRSGLTSIIIPEGVTYISDDAFFGCINLSSIIVEKNNKTYDSRDNCNAIIETATNKLIVACSNTSLPSSILSFNQDAFKNCVNIELPEGLETIYSGMFQDCEQLKFVVIPKSIKTIEGAAFKGCVGLTSFTIPSNTTLLGNSAFEGCTNLKTMIVEEGESPLILDVSGLRNNCFKDCPIEELNLGRDMYIENEYEKRGNNSPYATYYEPFKESQTLRKIVFGKNVTNVQSYYYYGCTNLKSVTFSDGLQTIGAYAFWCCANLESVVFPSSLTTIGLCAFSGCDKIKKVIIPNSVKQISRYAFSCANLDTVIIETSDDPLEFVVDYSECTTFTGPLKNVYIGRNFSCYYSPFNPKVPFNLTIGKNVTGISATAFCYLTGIKNLKLEESTDTLSFGYNSDAWGKILRPFSGTPIDSVYLGRPIKGSLGVSEPFHMTIGNNISEIGDGAYWAWNISSVIIPNSVKKIGGDAFRNCNYLNSVTIEDGATSLEFLNGSNFLGCPLESLYLGRDLSYDTDNSPFKYNKEALVSLTIGDEVTEIGESQFVGLRSITKIKFPSSLKKIGKQAFYGCEALTSISIPNSVIEIGQDAFDLTRNLSSFIIEDGDKVLSINNNFLNSPLNEVYVGRNITYPEDNSPFSMLETLSKLTIGNQVSSIGKTQYAGCQNLKDVVTYAVDVPATEKNVFTESYLADATLHVLDVAYKNYRVKYPWNRFKNFMLIDENGNETSAPSITGNEGDASGDGVVNAADIVEIVSYMMGFPSENFIFNNADINGDGVVNGADIVQIANIIMGE